MEKFENNFLYLVVLGGRAKKSNVELHDVRWVVGSKIEDTYNTLRREKFENNFLYLVVLGGRAKKI